MMRHLKSVLSAMGLLSMACGSEVKMVEVDPSNISFTNPSQSEKLEAKAQDIHGAEVPNVPFTYRSENPSVATVESDGTVKPAGNGSCAVMAETPQGVTGEAFVKVCLPKEVICDPPETLSLKVGVSAPIKCHVTDCGDQKLPGRVTLTPADAKMLLKEGDDIFIGLAVGDTQVTVEAFGLKKSVAVRVDEQSFLPGMAPGSGGNRRGQGGDSKKRKDPYASGGGRFDHIIGNMKFN